MFQFIIIFILILIIILMLILILIGSLKRGFYISLVLLATFTNVTPYDRCP